MQFLANRCGQTIHNLLRVPRLFNLPPLPMTIHDWRNRHPSPFVYGKYRMNKFNAASPPKPLPPRRDYPPHLGRVKPLSNTGMKILRRMAIAKRFNIRKPSYGALKVRSKTYPRIPSMSKTARQSRFFALWYYRFGKVQDHERRPKISFREGSFKRRFILTLTWVLRQEARRLGFYIAPDGYVKAREVYSYHWFERVTYQRFLLLIKRNFRGWIDTATFPQWTGTEWKDGFWIRSRSGQGIKGVNPKTKRISNMSNLPVVVYKADMGRLEQICRQGISPDRDRLIHLSQKAGNDVFPADQQIPTSTKILCVSIDAKKAVQLGVTFFHTSGVELVASGDHNGVIPPAAFKAIAELDVKMNALK